MPRLGLNIDHVATLRQARRTFEPEPVLAAMLAEMAGAQGITLHVREDRRHIQERDLELVCRLCRTRVNLEMAAVDEMVAIAISYKPEVVTLVPERRQEVTTEGGLDLVALAETLAAVRKVLTANSISVSAFIDPETKQVEMAKHLGFPIIELHTGAYANAKPERREYELKRLRSAAQLASSLGIAVSAGHGLTYYNVKPLLTIPAIEEFNIGHSIMARAILVGLDRAVREMLALISTPTDQIDLKQLFRNNPLI